MGVEVIDSSIDMNAVLVDEALQSEELEESHDIVLDARRRLEDKMEELRLARELREYDFDYDDLDLDG